MSVMLKFVTIMRLASIASVVTSAIAQLAGAASTVLRVGLKSTIRFFMEKEIE